MNAARCGRVHCIFMSPFFLVMAVFAVLFGVGIFETNARTWDILGAVTILGAAGIFFGSEAIFGRYLVWRRGSGV